MKADSILVTGLPKILYNCYVISLDFVFAVHVYITQATVTWKKGGWLLLDSAEVENKF